MEPIYSKVRQNGHQTIPFDVYILMFYFHVGVAKFSKNSLGTVVILPIICNNHLAGYNLSCLKFVMNIT